MKTILTHSIKINSNTSQLLAPTINIYRKALSYLIPIIEKHYEEIKDLKSVNEVKNKSTNDSKTLTKQSYVETLIHSTKNNKAIYDFDDVFYKYPSYLRRSTITDAIGIYESHISRVENWKKTCDDLKQKKKFKMLPKKPTLQVNHNAFPCFYNKEMLKLGELKIKLYINNDWKFVNLDVNPSDLRYASRSFKDYEYKIMSPRLCKVRGKYTLKLPLEIKSKLTDQYNKVMAIDLGLNTDVTACIMNIDGTIEARYFLDNPSEKDHLDHLLKLIKKKQSQGSRYNKRLWNTFKGLNLSNSINLVKQVIAIALKHKCDYIVLEHLHFNGKSPRSIRQKMHHWSTRVIYEAILTHAHINGMRVATVNPQNTSALAFDGTGKVLRGKNITKKNIHKSYSTCQFTTGKIYNTDLNAAYNIGARFFTRVISETLSAKKELDIQAKVPEYSNRTAHTLNTLLEVNKAIEELNIKRNKTRKKKIS